MKAKLGVLCGLLLAGANAMACYTVYDGNSRVVYRGVEAPVDMSLPLHQALETRFPVGSSLVFDQAAMCTPVSIAQIARPTGPNAPPNTIRMERTGKQISPSSSSSPLLTDRQTALRQKLPFTTVAGDVVMVPAQAAAHADMSTFTIVPSEVVAVRSVNTATMGAGPATSETVITEMRDPPVTIIQRGNAVSVQR